MRKRTDLGFASIRIEGGILPAEFFQKLVALEGKNQKPGDYGLEKGISVRDKIGRAWRTSLVEWQKYRDRRTRLNVSPVEVGVRNWLLRLLSILGFSDIQALRSLQRDGRSFPITHRACKGTVPMVLTTADYFLDRGDPRFGDEGRRRSPHALLQEYLNVDDDCLWGIVSNGFIIRLLRDNPSLTRPAFIEANLERMFEEELFPDFAAFWLLFHESRFIAPAGKPGFCTLEAWRSEAHEVGERALENMRKGVTQALLQLGNGFIQYPENTPLREALSTRQLPLLDYYAELLRLVYRLIFLLTMEDRDLLHDPASGDEKKQIYEEGYSISRLREFALKRHHYDNCPDLWEGLTVTFRALSTGAVPLGLPPLGGLFQEDQCPFLDVSLVDNDHLLKAVFALSFFRTGEVLARINYHDMGTEELGSVYESLLELHPDLGIDTVPWTFSFLGLDESGQISGHVRKLTGSYYTPSALVQELIRTALEPVIEKTIDEHPFDREKALLRLRVIDPACGSGHFLLAAARRLADELARIAADTGQPDDRLYRYCLRAVVRHCIYGVDLNPLAVELCKTALWLETVEPGKPLGFLDNHIRCGNSLIGVRDLKILAEGIPEKAYTVLTGDDRTAVRSLKETNRQSRRSVQGSLFDQGSLEDEALEAVFLDDMPEDTPEEIEAKRRAFENMQLDNTQRRMADLYTAAFFAPKTVKGWESVPVNDDLNRVKKGIVPRKDVLQRTREIAAKQRFFHWPLEFPDAFADGGFDVVIGNPPWERIKTQEEEFFASRSPEIANATNKAAREKLIKQLNHAGSTSVQKALFREFEDAKRDAEAAGMYIRGSGLFPLTAVGDINTYALFAELALCLLSPKGRAGIVVQSGIATDSSTKAFFDEITGKDRLVSLLDFENREKLFPAVDSRMKFCLLTLGREVIQSEFCFFATNTGQIEDPRRRFTLSGEDIRLLNPNTRTCPVFRSQADAELTKKIYSRVPVLIEEGKGEGGNPWGITFMRMFDMANDSHLFRTYEQLAAAGAKLKGTTWHGRGGEQWLPLYEAKMIHQFDHRWATYEPNGVESRDITDEEKRNPLAEPLPRYWIDSQLVEGALSGKWDRKWLLGFRDITNATNERTTIAMVIPRVGVGHTLPLIITTQNPKFLTLFLANLCSLVFDFVTRQKIGGTHLTYSYLRQLPVLSNSTHSPADLKFIVPRVLELTYTSESLRPWAEDLGYTGPPFPWDPDHRALIWAELDAYYAKLYGLTRDELRYILDPTDVYGEDYPSETFRVLKNNETRRYGEYRTRRLVLEAWDRMTENRKERSR